jgi:hypothetical protein
VDGTLYYPSFNRARDSDVPDVLICQKKSGSSSRNLQTSERNLSQTSLHGFRLLNFFASNDGLQTSTLTSTAVRQETQQHSRITVHFAWQWQTIMTNKHKNPDMGVAECLIMRGRINGGVWSDTCRQYGSYFDGSCCAASCVIIHLTVDFSKPGSSLRRPAEG